MVGATPEWMLANGYTQVGADFPVFLKDGEEYALARTERKTGAGYHGFEADSNPEITMEQDLSRRDLTVNSMAVELKYWNEFLLLCEKYRTSLEQDFLDEYVHNFTDHIFKKVVMMNGGAFKEDPVRVFRAVRMRHTLPEGEGCQFVADEWDYGARTWKAMEEMVASDDFKGLTPERVAQEVLKAASKCKSISQFAGFLTDLMLLGAIPSVMDGKFCMHEMDNEPVFHRGLTDKEAVAYMMLCMPDDYKVLQKRFKDRRYSNDAVNFGCAVHVIHKMFGVEGTSQMSGENLMQCMSMVNQNELSGALEFLSLTQEISVQNALYICKARMAVECIGLDDLTEEQQKTLTGRDIGAAIRAKRVDVLDHIICERSQKTA
ncbi:Multifunctional CCA protein [compost metagenome]